MLEQYNFTYTRLRYLEAAQLNIPDFHPDGKDVVYTSEQVLLASNAGPEFLLKFNAYNLAVGAVNAEAIEGHDAGVTVYGCMKSCYRKDATCTAAIVRLPKKDNTPDATLRRMQGLLACWSTLPNVPGTALPFAAGPWTQATFTTKTTLLENKIKAADRARSLYAGAIAELNGKDAEWDNFVTAALVQGRVLYPEGSVQRAYIDRIPTEPSQQVPEQAVIDDVTSPAAGEVHLEFSAVYATSFQVWHKGPGEAEFVKVADVLEPGIYDADELPAGVHEYQIVGENSRGTGPASVPASVTVLLAEAA